MKKIIFASLFIILGCSVTLPTPVMFPLKSFFYGANYVKGITITAVNGKLTDGTNLYAGSYINLTPSGYTNPIVQLQPNDYTLTLADVRGPLRFSVPDSNGVVNVLTLITNGLSSYYPVNPGGSGTATNLAGGAITQVVTIVNSNAPTLTAWNQFTNAAALQWQNLGSAAFASTNDFYPSSNPSNFVTAAQMPQTSLTNLLKVPTVTTNLTVTFSTNLNGTVNWTLGGITMSQLSAMVGTLGLASTNQTWLGTGALVDDPYSVSIGDGEASATPAGTGGVLIGNGGAGAFNGSINIGGSGFSDHGAIAIGNYAAADGMGNVAIGGGDDAYSDGAIIEDNTWVDTIELGRGYATKNGWLHFMGNPIMDGRGNWAAIRVGGSPQYVNPAICGIATADHPFAGVMGIGGNYGYGGKFTSSSVALRAYQAYGSTGTLFEGQRIGLGTAPLIDFGNGNSYDDGTGVYTHRFRVTSDALMQFEINPTVMTTSPANAVTPAFYLPIQINGTNFFLPVYH